MKLLTFRDMFIISKYSEGGTKNMGTGRTYLYMVSYTQVTNVHSRGGLYGNIHHQYYSLMSSTERLRLNKLS